MSSRLLPAIAGMITGHFSRPSNRSIEHEETANSRHRLGQVLRTGDGHGKGRARARSLTNSKKVTDLNRIMSFGVMTPALVVVGTRTLLESGLTPAEVMDLIPVKPLADMEAQVTEMYRTRLPSIYLKIKP
jgi:hypothetical protein